jgi:hypothetical protein
MSEISDPLLAEGKLITLVGGEQRQLVLRNRALRAIERRYGSMRNFIEGMRETYFDQLAFLFSLAFTVTEDQALDMIDSRRIQEYVTTVTEVLMEALGIEPPKPNDQALGEARSQESQSQSPGTVSSTAPWSPSESTRSTFGTA